MGIPFLDDSLWFPNPRNADSNGIVAMGGDLNPKRLLLAYQMGIFPWPHDDLLLWFSPDPRFVLKPSQIRINRSLQKWLRQNPYTVQMNTQFHSVIQNCAKVQRTGQDGTWINNEMAKAYCTLHDMGYAHSVEVYLETELVGGLYGIALKNMFFGESMFSKASNASKVGFVSLALCLNHLGFDWIDCQVFTPYLQSFGAIPMPRNQFLQEVKTHFC